MAEYAQKAIEEMLPEMDKMRKTNLFSIDETRAIMKKRKRFEYKTQRRTKEKEVYLQYIQYEIGVQQLVKLRREKRGIDIEKDKIDKPIALRIYRLFRMACFRFKHDVKLWLTHIDFAKKNHDKERVSKLFTTMLKVHNKKPNLWIMAAKFEFEINESVETARSLFQRALRMLPDRKKVWIEYFKMELMCVDLIMKRKELLGLTEQSADLETIGGVSTKIDDGVEGVEESADKKIEDSILSCKVVEVVFMNAIKQVEKNVEDLENINELVPELVFKLIKIANDFQFTSALIERMYKFIQDDAKLNKFEETWGLLARRSLLQEEAILKKCEETGQCADFTIAEFEDKANVIFLNALQELKTEKMHKIYLDFCIERLKLNSSFLNEERFKRLNDAFKKTQAQFGLSLDYTIEWIESLTKFTEFCENSEIISQIKSALVKHNSSESLWKLYLTIKISQTNESNEQELIDLFYKSIASVSQKHALDLWKLIINWTLLNNHKSTEKLLTEGAHVMENKEISSFSRLKYLHWSLHKPNRNAKLSGLAQVRKIYESLRQVPPFSVQFYYKYIEIETSAAHVDETRIISGFEDALSHFAKSDLDLWISYIDFVYSKSSKEALQEVSNIYWRAMKQLDAGLVDSFVQKFCLFKINLDVKNKLMKSPDDYDIEMDD